MSWMIQRRALAGAVMLPVVLLGSSVLSGCGALDVSDPTAIEEGELSNPAGATLMRGDAIWRLYGAVGEASVYTGLVTDELVSEWPAFFARLGVAHPYGEIDRRELQVLHRSMYGRWQEVRRAATLAIPAIQRYGSAEAQPRVGEMFAVRGFAVLRLAEDFCPGFPLHDLSGFTPVFGPPLTTEQAFERALADLDSALVHGADSTRIVNFARLTRGRALLALGRFNEAGEAVALVPTGYVENAQYRSDVASQRNPWGDYATATSPTSFPFVVANQEGGNGLDFVGAADPRLKLIFLRMSDRDGLALYAPAKYPNPSAPIVLASSLEARLIEAEAALNGEPGSGTWLTILNGLRTTCTDAATCPNPAPAGSGGVAGLPPLTDPGTEAARVNLLFRERAFWLFGTGHRLADLRRLISRYGRSVETVFPTGAYRLGGQYTTVTNLAFDPRSETPYSPSVTGCTSR